MSFLLSCPFCGPRPVDEYAYFGEVTTRPAGSPSLRELTDYVYFRDNVAGVQREWWYHRSGCRQWLQAVRNTTSDQEPLGAWDRHRAYHQASNHVAVESALNRRLTGDGQ